MKVRNGMFEQYDVDKLKEAVLDNYRKTGERHTHIEMKDSMERDAFLREIRRLGIDYSVEQIASLIYTVHYLGDGND